MNASPREIEWMRQALALAANGRGRVEPNPMVGCVIVGDDQVLGTGYHQRFGGPHAEPNALAACSVSPAGATVIVTLEPCCHTNKKTPPCVPALIHAGIRRVVIGHLDPNPAVSGKGARQLQEAGIEVVAGVLEEQCRQLNAPFFALMRHARPYVTLKWAQSADGLIGGSGNTPRAISNATSSRLVHHLRTCSDAILVSAATVLSDNPMLNVRGVPVRRTPIRIVLDSHLQIPEACRLVATARETPTHVFTTELSPKARQLESRGIVVHQMPGTEGHVDLRAVLHTLGEMGITHLLVEPGERLAKAFLDQRLADRIWCITSRKFLGEPDSPHAPAIPFPPVASRNLDGDTLTEYLDLESNSFFGSFASPEFGFRASPE